MNIEHDAVVVIGAGGHAKVVVATALEAGFKVTALLDDDSGKWGKSILGVLVIGAFDLLKEWSFCNAVIALGDNKKRKQIADRFRGRCEWLTIVHPRAYVHPSVRLGKGTVVFAGAIIQPDTAVGEHVIINTGTTVDHDCIIEDFAHLAPGTHLAGEILVKEGAFLGIGSKVIPGRVIGEWSVVGAGGVVINDITSFTTAVGVPALSLERADLG